MATRAASYAQLCGLRQREWDSGILNRITCQNISIKYLVISKITTRIRELIQGCAEVQLNLLTPTESISLLLETGKVEASDAASAAAGRIAKVFKLLICL